MDGHTAIITLGALEAARKGIVVVNSAGNSASDGTPNTLIAPADADSIITVGAVSGSGIRTSFSSYGNTVDHRIKPDVMAMGSGVYVADPSVLSGNAYTSASGTSFSCPLTAGACAVILSYNPNLTNMQIRDALRNTASRHLAPDSLYGWGIINALAAANYFPLTSVLSVKTINPDNFILYQNYPNPFNPSTTIKYFIPVDSQVKIVLFNILGNELKTLFNGNVTAGDHELELSASGLASGVYFVKVIAGGFQKTIKITLTK
jgi:subtilisin family serine protease